jgi:hypothetical protein
MTSLIKKPKGSKRNGVLSKYITVNKNNWSKFITTLFEKNSWYYLTVIFNGKEYKVSMILWKDEIEVLKSMITLPFKYRIYPISKLNTRPCLEIRLDKVPDIAKSAYETLDAGNFSEYYKQLVKGY